MSDEERARELVRRLFEAERLDSVLLDIACAALRSAREEERARCARICRELPLGLEDHKYPSGEERHLIRVIEAGCRGAFADAIESASERAGDRSRPPG